MVDFLKIDLENYDQPAIARLRDETENGEIHITQAHFDIDGTTITYLHSNRKPKERHYSTEEMKTLMEAWTEYQARVTTHKQAIREAFNTAFEKARALASSVHFDMEALNVQINKSPSYAGWNVEIPAIAYKRYLDPHDITKSLIATVQNAFNEIRHEVEIREPHIATTTHNKWKEIVASYRRVFPLEPQEITEAKRLLTEAGLTNWRIEPVELDPGYYSFYHEDESTEFENWRAAPLLDTIREYIADRQEVVEQGALKVKVDLSQAPAECDPTLTNEQEIAQFWASHKDIFKQAPDECDSTLNQIDQKAWDNAIADIDQIVDLF